MGGNPQNTNTAKIVVKAAALFDEAQTLHKHGQLVHAKTLYESLLKAIPNHFGALHMLGVIAHQNGKHKLALELMDKAIAVNPNVADVYNNRGVALMLLEQLDRALASYDNAIAINPGYAEAYHNRGAVLEKLKLFHAALANYNLAIALKPDYYAAYNNRGNVLQHLKETTAAIASYDQSIALKPDYAPAYNNRGNVFTALNRPDAALASYDQALAINPDYAEARRNRDLVLKTIATHQSATHISAMAKQALALHQRGQHAQAKVLYEEILKIQPDHFDALQTLGVIAYHENNIQTAADLMAKAIAINPNVAEVYSNRGAVLRHLKQFDAALESFGKALAIEPDHANAYNNRSMVLRELKQFDAALEDIDHAIALRPDYPDIHNNRGNVFHELKQLDSALACYDQAITLKPDYAMAHWNKSLILLRAGDFDRGWKEFEWRWDAYPSLKRNFTQPLWDGQEPLAGKTILLHSEQGLGDAIQFSRYTTLVSDLGGRVVLEAEKPLLNLFATLGGVAQLVETGSPLPAFELHCPLLSLPLAFNTRLDSIPSSVPYLSSDPAKVSKWQTRLGTKHKPRVGLAWSGSPVHGKDSDRNISLSQYLQHLPDKYQYVSLQKEIRNEDRETLQARSDILHFGDELNDFSDTAALCELMDVIISVDTSVAHLAGALGRPVWILLPYLPDWRWLLDRRDSPWYPTAILYRQDAIGDWGRVLEQVRSDLAKL